MHVALYATYMLLNLVIGDSIYRNFNTKPKSFFGFLMTKQIRLDSTTKEKFEILKFLADCGKGESKPKSSIPILSAKFLSAY